MGLTKTQARAVKYLKGNALINAGAGSGKTTVTTARIMNLIANENVEPSRILALTFTKEATENMRSRLAEKIGKKRAGDVAISTFHSFAYGIMRQKFPQTYKNKTIMQGWWKMSKLYDIVSPPTNSNPIGLKMLIKAGDLGSFISYQKANMIKAGMDVIIDTERMPFLLSETRLSLQTAFDTYCEHVEYAKLIDFDDMLVDFYYKLVDHENFRQSMEDSYDYIMVDEFQDTNSINLEIIKLISNNNLFVVGDFRQGIYGFINANIDNILNFNEMFDNVETIELQENFRSTKNIVDFANKIIEVAPVEKYKKFKEQLPARSDVGDKVAVSIYTDEYSEVTGIAEKIVEKVDSGEMEHNDFAVLTRTNAQIGFFESEFANMGIPVDVSTSRSFFDRKEIADLLAYAAHAVDEDDDMSIRRIMNSPNRFISKAVISQIDEYAYNHDMNFERACSTMDAGKSSTNVRGVVQTFAKLREHLDMNASKFLKSIYYTTKYEYHLEKTSSTHSDLQMKIDAIEKLFDMALKFASIKTFLGHVSVIKSNSGKNKDGVKLMTVHASKGLEFDYVFAPSATSDNYPHDMAQEVEEERRLFYVLCSRPKNTLELSFPVYTPKSEPLKISPFLLDVMGENLEKQRKFVLTGEKREVVLEA